LSLFKRSTTKSKAKPRRKKGSRAKGKASAFGGVRPWLIGAALVVIIGGVGVVKWSRTGSGQATLLTLGSDRMYSEVQNTVEEALVEALPGFNPGPADATAEAAGTRGGDHDWPAEHFGPAAAVRCRAVPITGDLAWWDIQVKVADALRNRGARVLWAERLYPNRRLPDDQTRPNEEKDFLRMDVGVPGRPTHTLVLHRAGRRTNIRWGAGPGSSAWSRFAAAEGPVVALLIDDWGYSKSEVARTILSVPAPLTLAVLPGLPYSRHFALQGTELVLPAGSERENRNPSESSAGSRRQRLAAGCFVEIGIGPVEIDIPTKRREIMLHLPMEPQGYPDPDPGPRAVYVGMDEDAIGARIDEAMQALPMITGVNNHMGSAATSDTETMDALMRALRSRDLLFIDSLTSSNSVAHDEARKAGLPTAKNRIFLDYDNENHATIKANLEVLVRSARSSGFALGIGHPHRATAEVLAREIPRLMAEGVRFVTVSEMLALRDGTALAAKGK
jgi:polysaccharide deacetylase 2 family uncharacterized protein YibQ